MKGAEWIGCAYGERQQQYKQEGIAFAASAGDKSRKLSSRCDKSHYEHQQVQEGCWHQQGRRHTCR